MTQVTTTPPTSRRPASLAWPAILNRAAGWSLFALIVATALVAGLVLRRWAWDQTEPVRYVLDINNAFRQGSETLSIGYLDRYDDQETQENHEGPMGLDYAPGRLAIATLWAHWVRQQVQPEITDPQKYPYWPEQFYTRARTLHRQYELCKPMLMVNLTGEILSAIALFFLVRRYTTGKPPIHRPVRGIVLGLVAALFFWFDPALICNAHCWPQWDSWVMPFFLWAILLASWDWWFCSGMVIAAGAMFKGQVLFGAPIFLLWPLFQVRLPAVVRWITGLFTAVAAITAVWLVRTPGTNPTGTNYVPGSVNHHAIEWLICLALIFLSMPSLFWWLRQLRASNRRQFWSKDFRASWREKLPLAWLSVLILLWPIHNLARGWVLTVILASVGMGLLLALAPRRVVPYAAAGWMATALLMCIPVFGASKGWFDLGIAYGTHHYEKMANGQLNNLPELLQQQWGWDDLMAPVFTISPGPSADRIARFLNQIDPGVHLEPGHEVDFPLKYFLLCTWLGSVVLCAIGAAVHDRNRSPQFLAAICAPWIVFFAVMTQMHQRYLLWGASLSAAASVISPGYAMLHLFLSIVSVSQELQSMLNDPFDRNNRGQYIQTGIYQFISHWHPGVAWAVLLTAAIFVYTAIRPQPSNKKQIAKTESETI